MIFSIYLLLLAILVFVIFWQLNLILAQIWGAPTVYANDKAIIDALNLAVLKKDQKVLDLGCGDGRSLIIAAKLFGAEGIGIERSPYCWIQANIKVLFSGERKRIKVLFGDFSKTNKLIKDADVIYLYLLNTVLEKNEQWLFNNLKKNSHIVSLSFKFNKHQPIRTQKTTNLGRETNLYLY